MPSNPNMPPTPTRDEFEQMYEKLTLDQRRIYEYKREFYQELVLKQQTLEERQKMQEYADRELSFWLEFLAHPERFRPTRLALVEAAGEVLERLQRDAYDARHYASTPEEQEAAERIAELEKQIQEEIWVNLPEEYRERLGGGGVSRITGVLLWARPLNNIDEVLRRAGKPGIVEIVQGHIPHSVDISVRWGLAWGWEQPILEHHYRMELPYRRTRGGKFVWGEREKREYTYGAIAFDLTDWVERIPDEELE